MNSVQGSSRWCAIVAVVALIACRGPARGVDHRESLPILRAFGLVYVEVGWDDAAPLLALLDTGASASAIDGSRAGELPSLGSESVVGTTGSVSAEMVELEDLRLGAIALPALRATRRDLGGLLSPDGRRVEMILGSDALRELAVTLDFPSALLELSTISRGGFTESVALVLDQGIPAIPATIGGVQQWLRLDTGASLFETPDVYINVPAHTWHALRERDPALVPSSQLQGTGADGSSVALPVAKVAGARIGPVDFDSVFVIVQPELGYFASADAKGFVGNNFLEKLGRVELDYRAGKLRCAHVP